MPSETAAGASAPAELRELFVELNDLKRVRSAGRPSSIADRLFATAWSRLAAGEGAPRVYAVEPTGAFENDPNVTDKRFPGNPTRSYRSTEPLVIVGEVTDWPRLAPEALQAWRDRLAVILEDERGEIIN